MIDTGLNDIDAVEVGEVPYIVLYKRGSKRPIVYSGGPNVQRLEAFLKAKIGGGFKALPPRT